jgi:hypothetical protein
LISSWEVKKMISETESYPVPEDVVDVINIAAQEGFVVKTAETRDACLAFFAGCVALCRPFCIILPKKNWAVVRLDFTPMPGCTGLSREAAELVEDLLSSYRLRPGSELLIGGQITSIEARREQAEDLARGLVAIAFEDLKHDYGDPLPSGQDLRTVVWKKAIWISVHGHDLS